MIGVEAEPSCYALHQVRDGGWESRVMIPMPRLIGGLGLFVSLRLSCVAAELDRVQPANHVATRRIWSQSPRKKDRTAR